MVTQGSSRVNYITIDTDVCLTFSLTIFQNVYNFYINVHNDIPRDIIALVTNNEVTIIVASQYLTCN